MALLLAACASTDQRFLERGTAQGERIEGLKADQVPVHGFTVWVEKGDGKKFTGELLAVEAERLWLETADGVQAVSVTPADRVVVKLSESDQRKTVLWSVVGALSTASHGYFLIFTLPAWAVTGFRTSGSAEHDAEPEVVPANLPRLYQFARFPQGLPAGFGEDGGGKR
jgi:hypothetical protein